MVTNISPEGQSRRSILIALVAAAGGCLGVVGSIAFTFLRYIVGAVVSPTQKAALLEESRRSMEGQINLLKLRIERVNNPRIPLAKLADLQEGNGVVFIDYALQPGVLFKTGERTCMARSAVCTHLGCTVQSDLVDGKIFCPCHQSYFNLQDGHPETGPATIALVEEPIVIEGDTVYLVKPESPLKIGPSQTPISAV